MMYPSLSCAMLESSFGANDAYLLKSASRAFSWRKFSLWFRSLACFRSGHVAAFLDTESS